MNFKRFNGSTWETVRHKIYGRGTDSLTAFPAVIQASGEALTDYLISGNTVQDGTPTPESPADVVGCGVWDETHQSYKLRLTVNGTEHPIYLGQVETTRKIKKLVLTGNETVNVYSGASIAFAIAVSGMRRNERHGYCTHFAYQYSPGQSTKNGITFGDRMYFTFSALEAAIVGVVAQDTTSFKSYLQQQYAAGTPITVWYVLAEPETAVVNEPLMKIGDYADTVSFAQAEVAIPTSDGDNTISFGTTVQPSAMSATFKGWHPVQGAKTYDGNDWS